MATGRPGALVVTLATDTDVVDSWGEDDSGDVADEPVAFVDAPSGSGSGSAYFANCTQAREAGAAPLYAGEPGYRDALDRDRDGVACEV